MDLKLVTNDLLLTIGCHKSDAKSMTYATLELSICPFSHASDQEKSVIHRPNTHIS